MPAGAGADNRPARSGCNPVGRTRAGRRGRHNRVAGSQAVRGRRGAVRRDRNRVQVVRSRRRAAGRRAADPRTRAAAGAADNPGRIRGHRSRAPVGADRIPGGIPGGIPVRGSRPDPGSPAGAGNPARNSAGNPARAGTVRAAAREPRPADPPAAGRTDRPGRTDRRNTRRRDVPGFGRRGTGCRSSLALLVLRCSHGLILL